MFTAYWEMQFDPFSKSASCKYPFESGDFKQATARLKHLQEIKGIGLFTGTAGSGKTYTLKEFVGALNPSLFKTVYLPLSSITNLEFFRAVALGLGIDPPYKKIDLFNSIQERILSLSREKRITTVIILDEGQHLSPKILNDLKILTNFDMDSERHVIIVLSGLSNLANTLSMHAHEALAQRIVINYTFSGLSKDEVQGYIESRLESCGVKSGLFAENALEALWGSSGGSPRMVNSLAEKCLMIGFQKNTKFIDPEIVMLASNEISLV